MDLKIKRLDIIPSSLVNCIIFLIDLKNGNCKYCDNSVESYIIYDTGDKLETIHLSQKCIEENIRNRSETIESMYYHIYSNEKDEINSGTIVPTNKIELREMGNIIMQSKDPKYDIILVQEHKLETFKRLLEEVFFVLFPKCRLCKNDKITMYFVVETAKNVIPFHGEGDCLKETLESVKDEPIENFYVIERNEKEISCFRSDGSTFMEAVNNL